LAELFQGIENSSKEVAACIGLFTHKSIISKGLEQFKWKKISQLIALSFGNFAFQTKRAIRLISSMRTSAFW
jgi:hypothetical protein